MHLLLIGGSYTQPGGIESFTEQSARALKTHDPSWTIHHIPAETVYLTVRRLPIFFRQLARIVAYRRNRPDLVWLQYGNLPDLVLLFAIKLAGMRVMVTPHLGSNWRSQKNPVWRRLGKLLLAAADRLALISKTQEAEIALPPNVPRSLIRNFLPEYVLGAEPKAGEQPPRLRLLHSARLSAEKGTFKVVEVSARLRDAGVQFETHITGGADPETYARLDALIAERGLKEHVTVHGRVSQDELVARMREADVLLHLSSIDSYPLVLLEVIAFGVLPVAMELAGARDMIETYDGHIVSVENAVEEAADWLIAADLADLRRRGEVQSRAVRADYAWSRCAGALDAALRATIAGDKQIFTEPERTAPALG